METDNAMNTNLAENGHVEILEAPSDLPLIVTLCKEKPFAWALMPDFLERVRQFCIKYDTDNEPDILARSVMLDFVRDEPGFFIMVAVRDYNIVGHLLACISTAPWGTKKRLAVLQHKDDEGAKIPEELLQAGLKMLVRWGREQGATQMTTVATNKEVERRLHVFYGFETDMMQMKRGL